MNATFASVLSELDEMMVCYTLTSERVLFIHPPHPSISIRVWRVINPRRRQRALFNFCFHFHRKINCLPHFNSSSAQNSRMRRNCWTVEIFPHLGGVGVSFLFFRVWFIRDDGIRNGSLFHSFSLELFEAERTNERTIDDCLFSHSQSDR